MIEVAARLGGGHDAELCELALGVDLNGAAIDAAFGDPVDALPRPRAGGGCVRFLVAPRGTLDAVDGLEEAGVAGRARRPDLPRPAMFGPLRRGADRAGAILATGESRDDALAKADRPPRIVFRVT